MRTNILILSLPNKSVVYNDQGSISVDKLTEDQSIYDTYGFLLPIKSLSEPASVDVYKVTLSSGESFIVGAEHQFEVFVNNQIATIITAKQFAENPDDNAFINVQRQMEFNTEPNKSIRDIVANFDLTTTKLDNEIKYQPLAQRNEVITGLMRNDVFSKYSNLVFDKDHNTLRDDVIEVIKTIGLLPIILINGDDTYISISWQPRVEIVSIEKCSRKQKCRTIEI